VGRWVAGALDALSRALLTLGIAGAAAPVWALDADSPTALGELHFARLQGFDAVEAYELRQGGRLRASFAVARRWRGNQAELFIKFQTPRAASRVAVLLRHSGSRSDDLFVYLPGAGSGGGRVYRATAILPEEQVISGLLPLGELRPIGPGELEFTRLPDREVQGERCSVVAGRPRHRGLGFDRVELAISPKSGVALESRYFVGSRETRRTLIAPEDFGNFGERSLPVRRRLFPGTRASDAPGGAEPEPVAELLLRNLMLDPELPERLFSVHNLRMQHFPGF
jgi:hypothetical protein